MADIAPIAEAVVEALNARDFAALAGKVHEDVAISGIGDGMDNGQEALRARLAHHFAAFDESYRDALVMTDAGGANAAVRLTAHGRSSGAAAYSREKVLLLEADDGRITRIALLSGL